MTRHLVINGKTTVQSVDARQVDVLIMFIPVEQDLLKGYIYDISSAESLEYESLPIRHDRQKVDQYSKKRIRFIS